MKPLHAPLFTKYFNFLVTRVIPDRFEFIAQLDCLLLRALRPIGRLLAGRVLFSAHISKPASSGVQ